MKTFIALGSNLGDRRANLERAVRLLKSLSPNLRASPVFQTPALVPEDAPPAWRIPYLNAVVELDWLGTAQELLNSLKAFERELGRDEGPRWSPRLIDLDVLLIGDKIINEPAVRVPHPEMWNRSFVLDPLKHLAPSLTLPTQVTSVLARSRGVKGRSPLWMGVFNLTPDSFSDSGVNSDFTRLIEKITAFSECGGNIVDLGAESTRPGAQTLTPLEEWGRLKPVLEATQQIFKSQVFSPKISIDTYHFATAAKALAEFDVSMINDVGALGDPAMLEVLKSSQCDYVLMHSLSVPADTKKTLPSEIDPVAALRSWALSQLELLARSGIALDRVIFDPGIGFGKTAHQSLVILQRIEELFDLPVRILVGHSRKSFMSLWNKRSASERDPESIGVSMSLAQRGVDILRVHEPSLHVRAHQAFQEVQT
jgi:2-amino-4-hydroxy-6-hydroxymethyldihydropteridine diphosphokinase/dihydropteroate synthase